MAGLRDTSEAAAQLGLALDAIRFGTALGLYRLSYEELRSIASDALREFPEYDPEASSTVRKLDISG